MNHDRVLKGTDRQTADLPDCHVYLIAEIEIDRIGLVPC